MKETVQWQLTKLLFVTKFTLAAVLISNSILADIVNTKRLMYTIRYYRNIIWQGCRYNETLTPRITYQLKPGRLWLV